MLGYLRETSELARKAGPDREFNIIRSGLDEYLAVIFPETDDWVHDKSFSHEIRTRPDYRSDSLKLVIEFDGLPHYTNPDIIRKDGYNTEVYEHAGYSVVRIPLFVQLTPAVILRLFNKVVFADLVFPESSAVSFSIKSRFTPAYIPVSGLYRMAEDFLRIAPEQLETNLIYLKQLDDDFISGYSAFKKIIDTLQNKK